MQESFKYKLVEQRTALQIYASLRLYYKLKIV